MKLRFIVLILIGLAVLNGIVILGDSANAPTNTPDKAIPSAKQSVQKLLVNKQTPLVPKNYVPQSLVVPEIPMRANITANERLVAGEIAADLRTMVAKAAEVGVQINLQSGYRSYESQTVLYDSYVADQGQKSADTFSAKPGYSEHQTGLAVDLGGLSQPDCDVRDCYASTAEYSWLSQNAHKYGFIVRYPAGKQKVTGYIFEPWHYRYIGVADATRYFDTKAPTLEEFYDKKPSI